MNDTFERAIGTGEAARLLKALACIAARGTGDGQAESVVIHHAARRVAAFVLALKTADREKRLSAPEQSAIGSPRKRNARSSAGLVLAGSLARRDQRVQYNGWPAVLALAVRRSCKTIGFPPEAERDLFNHILDVIEARGGPAVDAGKRRVIRHRLRCSR